MSCHVSQRQFSSLCGQIKLYCIVLLSTVFRMVKGNPDVC
uniref:Uncharacterized protein n=1 Tax=Anguilla anguilla TaxID=7936 RepID=A0A0E9TXL0_ANGAN